MPLDIRIRQGAYFPKATKINVSELALKPRKFILKAKLLMARLYGLNASHVKKVLRYANGIYCIT